MNEGWKCPCCGKAHAPHVVTCPEPTQVAGWPVTPHEWPRVYPTYIPSADHWPYRVTSGDLPGTCSAGTYTGEAK